MIIQYGIGENYLKDWGINEALREIYQNFMDYGKFTQKTIPALDYRYLVLLHSDYSPENLEFLKIGESQKNGNKEAIGQHGEGLKMALLIFLRLGYRISVQTPKYIIYPEWNEQPHIGKSLSLKIDEQTETFEGFGIKLYLPKNEFEVFNNNLIKQKDIIFHDDYYGDIVNKTVGNFYVGKLFVCNIKNFKKAYNLNPSIIKLDRDRKIPGAWESSYFTSKLNEAEGKFNFVDQNYDDMKYVASIPQEKLKSIKPKVIGNNIEFIAHEDGKEIIVKNDSIKNHLKQQSYFKKALDGIKRFLLSKLGVIDLIKDYREKHCNSDEARFAFDAILERLGINIETNKTEVDL